MAFAKTTVFEMDRRHLLKMTGALGIGATFINPHELFAAGTCENVTIPNGTVVGDQAGATLQFWIDGLHFGARTDVPSRANITLFMDLMQTPASYVEAVVFMDSNKNTLGARFFDPTMKMTDGHVPYVRIDNIALDPSQTYYCVYTVKTGTQVKLYTATIQNPVVSTLNNTFLPQQMRQDFENFLTGKFYTNGTVTSNNATNPTPGLITTQFQYYTRNGLATHTARGRIQNIGSDASFTMAIDYMHADLEPDHYMRYFIVMDPVGRLLGLHKRLPPGDPGYDGQSSGTLDVTQITEAQKTAFQIPDLQVANILDCPYVQFYTEDSYDAIARNLLRCR